jgi:hypothetical protein
MAAHSKGRIAFGGSNSRIVGSNPTQGKDVCLRLLCVVFV